jgi:hypothetical protein
MKSLKLLTFCFVLSLNTVLAANNLLWLRYPAISPDGSQIAFSYKGDIYTVPVSGGQSGHFGPYRLRMVARQQMVHFRLLAQQA